ncbi:substrate-binding periplasmic protein [Parathalassolituus penaei]|uniref:Transporter substrate-binding domain-containing protein n=1 Tax=Parathalassolituus penaei TaxID=2997323 RepID=A0A9X3EB14_9GAMM|nr:transporter substrate-binding domain-containing protein [Parathalassolituus penaei]MCY0963896.1 transporter substrate-binding domain-containing protein [Parathalassolituus penaei]
MIARKIACCVLGLGLPLLSVADSGKLVFYTEQFPPYNMTANDKEFAHNSADVGGLCTEIVKALMAQVDYEYRIKLRNWSLGMDRVQKTPNTGIFCAVQTPERLPKFSWVGPLTSMNWALFAKPDSTISISSLSDAGKYTIGGYKGDAMTGYLISKGLNVSVVPEDISNPKRLQQGLVDLWVTDTLAGPLKASRNSNLSSLKKVLDIDSTPVFLALNPDTPKDVVAAMQASLDALKADGTVRNLEQKYQSTP